MRDTNVRRMLMTGDTVGGVWTFTMELADALGHHGVEVVLASLGAAPTRAQRIEAKAIPNLRLLPSDFKLEWMTDPWHDVKESGRWLLNLEKEYSPDVVHLNSFGHGALPWRTPVVLTAHSCVASWWAAVRRAPLPYRWRRYRRQVELSLQSANFVTAPTRAMLETLTGNYGVDVRSCRVIANGRNPSDFHCGRKEKLIFTAGRLWDEAKNVEAVVEVAPRLPWPVYLAGEQRHPNVTPLRLSGCHLLGHLPSQAMTDWYARAAIYVMPARYEPFGLSPLEAALSGCALVLGDIPSLREVWEDGAIFVEPDDTEALETALRELIENPVYRKEVARRGINRARTFTPQRMASGYMSLYRSAAELRKACAS